MISSVLVVAEKKHDIVGSARFFTDFGVSQVHTRLYDEVVANANQPLADVLVILHDEANWIQRSPALDSLRETYTKKNSPVLEYGQKAERLMHAAFIKLAFGDSLDVLRSESGQIASKVLFVISRFFRTKPFYTKDLKLKYHSLTGKDLASPLACSYCKSFCKQNYLEQKKDGSYKFLGLDKKAEEKLRRAGFDIFSETPPPTEPSAAPPAVPPTPEVPSLNFLHEEFALLRKEMSDQLHTEVQRIFQAYKINNRLLHLNENDLAKVESFIEYVAFQKSNF